MRCEYRTGFVLRSSTSVVKRAEARGVRLGYYYLGSRTDIAQLDANNRDVSARKSAGNQ